MTKDYYSTLGVAKTASKDEIKKAYKKLALTYHPDTSGGNMSSEEKEKKFKEISEAYAVLSDEKKKQQYDTFGSDFQDKFSQNDIFSGVDFRAVFDELKIQDLSDLFSGSFSGSRQRHRARPKGRDVLYPLEVEFLDAFHGTKKSITYHLYDGAPQHLTVTIPPGVRDGVKLKISGKGSASPLGGDHGDLYIQVSVGKHNEFERHGDDIITTKNIPISLALLGGKVDLNTCDGLKQVRLPSPVNFQAKLRLKGLGFPIMHSKGARGDLFCQLALDLPNKLTDKQRSIASDLKDIGL